MTERIEISRTIPAPAADIFAVLSDPQGHVAIDSTGMLQDADGDPVKAVGDSFVVHMDRAALNDYPQLGKYDVTVEIKEFEQDRLISWTILGQLRPQIGHIFKVGENHQGYLNLKGYKEFDAAHRPDGWNVWATLVISPAAEQKPAETKRPRIVK